MRNLSILLLFIMSINAMADCDFSTGIQQGANKTFIYTEECHQAVGKLVQDNKVQSQQLSDLTQALDLKNAALATADTRTEMWKTTAENEQDRMNKISDSQSKSDWLMFGLGCLTVLGSGFLAARLIGR